VYAGNMIVPPMWARFLDDPKILDFGIVTKNGDTIANPSAVRLKLLFSIRKHFEVASARSWRSRNKDVESIAQ